MMALLLHSTSPAQILSSSLLLLLVLSISVSYGVPDVRRIPSQPVQLRSGDSLVLLCTVTTNTLDSVQWYNGTSLLTGNGVGLSFTPPYRLNNVTWQAAMEVAVLTEYSSGWYYCQTNGSPDYGGIQLNVLSINDDGSSLIMNYPSSVSSLYATIPFNMSCTGTVLTDGNQLLMEIDWYRNDQLLLTDDSLTLSIDTQYVNSTTVEGVLTITEPLPLPNVQYKCELRVTKLDIIIHTIDKSTPDIEIKVAPLLVMSVESNPADGPSANSMYTLICSGTIADPAILASKGSSLSVRWLDSDNNPVLSSSGLTVGPTESGQNGSYHTSLTFTKVTSDLTYTCHGSLTLYEYPDIPPIIDTLSTTITAPVLITTLVISPLPSDSLDWYAGSDGALSCTIQTNKPITTSDLNIDWHDSMGRNITSDSISFNPTVSLSTTLYQSVLVFRSLSVQSELYYCRAGTIAGSTREDWHFIHVESDLPMISLSLYGSDSATPTSPLANVGQPFSLFCSSAKPPNINGQPEILWFRPSGAPVKQGLGNIIIEDPIDNGTHYVSELRFTPAIECSQAGEYLCRIQYSFYGLTDTIEASDSVILRVQAPSPFVSIITSSESSLQCIVQVNTTDCPFLSIVYIAWYLTDYSENTVDASTLPGVTISDILVLKCNEVFSSMLGPLLEGQYRSVSCVATVSMDTTQYAINNSTSAATVAGFQALQDHHSSSAIPITVEHIGSRWAQITWRQDNDLSTHQFHVKYWAEIDGQTMDSTMLSNDRIHPPAPLPSNVAGLYRAILTDLTPATHYTLLVVQGTSNGVPDWINTTTTDWQNGTRQFITNETVPSGIPVNLNYSLSHDGSVLLRWDHPLHKERNGIIIDYNVSCEPGDLIEVNNTIISLTGGVTSLYGIVVNTVYQCRVAAVNREGIGPAASVRFSLSFNDIGNGIEECGMDGLHWNNYMTYIPPGIVGGIAILIIIILLGTTCYHIRKYKSLKELIYSPLSRPPRLNHDSTTNETARPTAASNPYVSTNVVDNMMSRRTHKGQDDIGQVALNCSQSSVVPLNIWMTTKETEC